MLSCPHESLQLTLNATAKTSNLQFTQNHKNTWAIIIAQFCLISLLYCMSYVHMQICITCSVVNKTFLIHTYIDDWDDTSYLPLVKSWFQRKVLVVTERRIYNFVCDAEFHLICEKEKTNGSLVSVAVSKSAVIMNIICWHYSLLGM
jgi:hypothetical protein